MVVVHYTGMQTAKAALKRLCDPAAQVSAHYLIEENGDIYQLVPNEKRAWHAGVSYWMGQNNLNDCSIGIELVNPGHDYGYRPFEKKQMQAALELMRCLIQSYPIPARRIVGHSDIAPTRKIDPGELFDWAWLAQHGVGLWPSPIPLKQETKDFYNFASHALEKIGYQIISSDKKDLIPVIQAFQRRFRPKKVDGNLDQETITIINGMVSLLT